MVERNSSSVTPNREKVQIFKNQSNIEVDDQSGVEHLGVHNYTDIVRGLYELHGNGLWACDFAEDNDLIQQGHITIRIEEQQDQLILYYKENGVGMDDTILENEYSTLGVSDGDAGNRTSKFGVGVVAILLLVGFYSGDVFFETRERPNGDPYRVNFSYDGGVQYEKADPESLTLLDADEYGTAYELMLTDELEYADIQDWIAEITQLNSYPITVIDTISGSTTTYEPCSLESFVETQERYPTFNFSCSDDLLEIGLHDFKPHSHHEITVHIFINDFEIPNLKFTTRKSLPYKKVFVQLHTEDSVIIDPDHKDFGMEVIPEGLYDSLTENEQQNFVNQSNLPESTPVTPRLIGNREDAEMKPAFKQYIFSQIDEFQGKELSRIIQTIAENGFSALQADDAKRLFRDKKELSSCAEPDQPYDTVAKQVIKLLDAEDFIKTVHVPEHISIFDTYMGNLNPLYTYAIGNQYNSDIYLAVRPDPELIEKCTNDGNMILEFSYTYVDAVQDVLDLPKLIDNYEKEQTGTNETTFTLHYGDKGFSEKETKKFTESELLTMAKNNNFPAHNIICFPPETPYNLSDYNSYQYQNLYGYMNVTKSVYTKLRDCSDSVIHINEFIESCSNTRVTTATEQERKLSDVLNDTNTVKILWTPSCNHITESPEELQTLVYNSFEDLQITQSYLRNNSTPSDLYVLDPDELGQYILSLKDAENVKLYYFFADDNPLQLEQSLKVRMTGDYNYRQKRHETTVYMDIFCNSLYTQNIITERTKDILFDDLTPISLEGYHLISSLIEHSANKEFIANIMDSIPEYIQSELQDIQ